MATKQFYATGSFKYGTRMMKAGDPIEMDAPTARLYTALKKISAEKVKAPKAETVEETVTPKAEPKATPRKRNAKRKASAKK